MKKRISAIMALLLAASMTLASCGSSQSSASTPAGESSSTASGSTAAGGELKQEITFALQNEPDILDPNVTSNSFASPFLDNLFEGLVAYDKENNLVAANAESWEISEDGLTYTFHLREGLKWSDGSPLTSQDYLFTFQRILTPVTAAQYLNMLTDYVVNAQEFYDGTATAEDLGIKAPDEKTLVVTLKQPTPFFLSILTMYTFSPTKQAIVEAEPQKWAQSAENYISNGPFMMSEFNFGESVVLVKNPNYWDNANVTLEKVTFRYILDASTALSAFESGEVDGIRFVPPADLPRLKTESDALQIIPSFATTYYLYNFQNETLQNQKVRQALSLAIDRTAIIENVLQSTDSPAYGLVSPGYSVDGKDYADGRSSYGLSATANVEEAKKLLAEAGYPNGEGFPKLRLSYYSDTIVKKVAEALAQMWQQNLGIQVEITSADWKVFYDSVQKGDYDIAAMGWAADYLHPMSFLPLFYTNDVMNNSFYSNPAYDTIVNQAKTITDPAEAAAVMRQAEDVLMADMPFLPLYHRSIQFMMRPGVQDWNMTPLQRLFLKDAKVVA